jgi:hypothetical protein
VSTLFFRLSRIFDTAARKVAVTPTPVFADASTTDSGVAPRYDVISSTVSTFGRSRLLS